MPSHSCFTHVHSVFISSHNALAMSTSKPCTEPSGAVTLNGGYAPSVAKRICFQSLAVATWQASIRPASSRVSDHRVLRCRYSVSAGRQRATRLRGASANDRRITPELNPCDVMASPACAGRFAAKTPVAAILRAFQSLSARRRSKASASRSAAGGWKRKNNSGSISSSSMSRKPPS